VATITGLCTVLSAQSSEPILFWDKPGVDSCGLHLPELIIKKANADTSFSKLLITIAHDKGGLLLVLETHDEMLLRRSKIDFNTVSYSRIDTIEPDFFNFLRKYGAFPKGELSADVSILYQEGLIQKRSFKWYCKAPLEADFNKPFFFQLEETGKWEEDSLVLDYSKMEVWQTQGLFPFRISLSKEYIRDSVGLNVANDGVFLISGPRIPLFSVSSVKLQYKGWVLSDTARLVVWKPISTALRSNQLPLFHQGNSFQDQISIGDISKSSKPLLSKKVVMKGDITLESEQYSKAPYVNETPLSVFRFSGNAAVKLGIAPFQLGFLVSNEQNHFYRPNSFYYRFDRDQFVQEMESMRKSLISTNTQEIQLNEMAENQLAATRKEISKRITDKQNELEKLESSRIVGDSLSLNERIKLENQKRKIKQTLTDLNKKEAEMQERLQNIHKRSAYDSSNITELFPDGPEDKMDSRDIRKTLKKAGRLDKANKLLAGVLDFEFGQVYRSYSRYSLLNIGVSGATFGYDLDKVDVFVLRGKMLTHNNPIAAGFPTQSPDVTAVKAVFKHKNNRKSNFVMLDGTATASTNRMPDRKNTVVSIGYQSGDYDKTKVEYEVAATINGLTDETASVSDLLYNALLDPKKYAGMLKLSRDFNKITIEGSFEQVNPAFYSIGNLFQRRNFREISGGAGLLSLNDMLKSKFKIKYLRNDLDRKNDAIGVVVDTRFTARGWPSLELYYAPYFIENQTNVQDSIQYIRNSQAIFRGASRYSKRNGKQLHTVMLVYQKSLMDFDQDRFSTESASASYSYQRNDSRYALSFYYNKQSEVYADTLRSRVAFIPSASLTASYSVDLSKHFSFSAEISLSPEVPGQIFGSGSGLGFHKGFFRINADWIYRSDYLGLEASAFHTFRVRLNAFF